MIFYYSNMKLMKSKKQLGSSYVFSAWLTRMPELSRFVYVINHLTVHVNFDKTGKRQLKIVKIYTFKNYELQCYLMH